MNIDPSGQQVLVNWKNCRQIRQQQIVNAVCDIAHRWTIYLSVMCQKTDGEQYCKSIEVAPQGNYLALHLTDVIETTYTDLRAQCNPQHVVAAGWIAIPADLTLEETQAAAVFEAVGAWRQVKFTASNESAAAPGMAGSNIGLKCRPSARFQVGAAMPKHTVTVKFL